MTNGSEHIEHDDIEEAFSQLSIEAPTILDEPMMELEANKDFEDVLHATVPSHEIEKVSFPMELGLFNCCILQLVDFPESNVEPSSQEPTSLDKFESISRRTKRVEMT